MNKCIEPTAIPSRKKGGWCFNRGSWLQDRLPVKFKGALSHFRILLSILLIILNNSPVIQVLAAK